MKSFVFSNKRKITNNGLWYEIPEKHIKLENRTTLQSSTSKHYDLRVLGDNHWAQRVHNEHTRGLWFSLYVYKLTLFHMKGQIPFPSGVRVCVFPRLPPWVRWCLPKDVRCGSKRRDTTNPSRSEKTLGRCIQKSFPLQGKPRLCCNQVELLTPFTIKDHWKKCAFYHCMTKVFLSCFPWCPGTSLLCLKSLILFLYLSSSVVP